MDKGSKADISSSSYPKACPLQVFYSSKMHIFKVDIAFWTSINQK